MTRVDPPPPDQGSGTLGLAVVLALIAGFVDSHIYLHVADVFVANMSGNLIRLGMFTGLERWHEVWRSLVAIPAFVCGAALGTRLNRHELRHSPLGRSRGLLAIEAVLLSAVLVALLVSDDADRSWTTVSVIVGIGAMAMGLQAAVLGRVGNIAVTTTYGTGSLVRVGQHLVRPAPGVPPESTTRSAVVLVLAAVLAGYVIGAAVAARAGGDPWLMAVPVLGLAGAALWARPHRLQSARGSSTP